MTTDITELAQSLKAAAENATPGEWCSDDQYGIVADAGLNGNYYIASCSGPEHRSNKRFIALANPANVLALVEALEKAQRANGYLREPVAYRWNYGGATIWRLLDTKPGPGSNPRCPRVIEPLYRHAQQPVVPDEVTYAQAEKLSGWESCSDAWADGWNACRAAMLQKPAPVVPEG